MGYSINMKTASLTLSSDELGIIIDSIHDRFIAVQTGVEPHPPVSRARMLESLGLLHGKMQAAEGILRNEAAAAQQDRS